MTELHNIHMGRLDMERELREGWAPRHWGPPV
jgi:hypothetical protein